METLINNGIDFISTNKLINKNNKEMQIGNLTKLNTTEKTTLVYSLNEVLSATGSVILDHS